NLTAALSTASTAAVGSCRGRRSARTAQTAHGPGAEEGATGAGDQQKDKGRNREGPAAEPVQGALDRHRPTADRKRDPVAPKRLSPAFLTHGGRDAGAPKVAPPVVPGEPPAIADQQPLGRRGGILVAGRRGPAPAVVAGSQ